MPTLKPRPIIGTLPMRVVRQQDGARPKPRPGTKMVKATKANLGPGFPVPPGGFWHPKGAAIINPNGRKGPPEMLNVAGVQHFLRNHGYDIAVDGKLGRLTKSAMADYFNPKKLGGTMLDALQGTHITGRRDPHDWNRRFGSPATHDQVSMPRNQGIDRHGNETPGGNTGPVNTGTVNLTGLGRIAAAAGTPIPTSLADKLASASAGEQYDPQIHDIQTLLAQQPVDAAQHQKDIGNWYGQVLDALNNASTRDTAATKAGVGSLKDAVGSIISSLGGSANQGSGDVGAMGANDVGTIQALGTSQDMLNNDMAPILQGEKASQLKNQANQDALGKAQMQQQLEDLQGQRGQAIGSQKANLLMQILDSNNKTAEQNFQDRLALQQAGEAAQLNGLKALYYGSKSNQPTRGSFGYATPSEINNVQNAILSHILDANGNLKPGMTMAKATSLARTVGGTYFPGGGMPGGWAQSVVAPYFGS